MTDQRSRRDFLKTTSAAALGAAAVGAAGKAAAQKKKRSYGISLAGWSLHRTIKNGDADKVPMLDMPKMAREEWDIEAIELVNNMLRPNWNRAYYDQLAKNAADHNVKLLLIMVDGQGNIGAEDEAERAKAVAHHSYWIDVAADLGCHSIRMNWRGAPNEVVNDPAALKTFVDRSVPGFRGLCDLGDVRDINVIIENHGGASSHPAAIDQLAKAVDHERFGTLPDFGNFPKNEDGSYAIDVYDGIDKLMYHAKAVSAKCYDFDDTTGLETVLDFERIIEIVADKHGYTGYIGIEYEGRRQGELEGIRAANELLKKLRDA
jgi:sugar phosphate isomerase/epimerase